MEHSRRFVAVAQDDEIQPLIDAAVDAAWETGVIKEHESLTALGAFVDDNCDVVNECLCSGKSLVFAPDLDHLVMVATQTFEGRATQERVMAHWRRTLASALDGDQAFWGDNVVVPPGVPVVGEISHSDGRKALLVFFVDDYLTGPYDWQGVYSDWNHLASDLRRSGHLLSLDDFDALPAKKVLRLRE
ncbi:MAG: hypothetical protein IPP20_11295 [Gemmatimonadetes bacterium]|nr:hypothetical protein [Gemmatimonadota bacterium]